MLGLKTERMNQSFLHKIVCASFVNEDDDMLLEDSAQQVQCFRGQVTRESIEANLGLSQV